VVGDAKAEELNASAPPAIVHTFRPNFYALGFLVWSGSIFRSAGCSHETQIPGSLDKELADGHAAS